MTGRVDLRPHFDHFPNNAEWTAISDTDCHTLAARLLGGPIDPAGKFAAYAVLVPTLQSWAFGDRTVWCGLGSPPRDLASLQQLNTAEDPNSPVTRAPLISYVGEARGVSQTFLFPPGSCLAETTLDRPDVAAGAGGGHARGTVPCDQPHTDEVVGSVDISGRASSDPTDAQEQQLFGPPCEAAVRTYVGRPLAENETYGWFSILPASWDAGRRATECTVSRMQGSTPVPVSGSLRNVP